MEYNIENVEKYLSFSIKNFENVVCEPWDYPQIQVDNLKLQFSRYLDLSRFLYCLKRENDFNQGGLEIQNKSTTLVKMDDLRKNIAFDSSLNIISNRDSSEKKEFDRDIESFHRAKKAFWGTYLSPTELMIKTRNTTETCNYTLERESPQDQIVIIQPPDYEYDESFPVYIKTDLGPTKSMKVAYVFQKNMDVLTFIDTNKNDWIY